MAYSIRQLADRWNTSERTIRRMIDSGQLTVFTIGTGSSRAAVRIHKEAVEAIETPLVKKRAPKPRRQKVTPIKKWV